MRMTRLLPALAALLIAAPAVAGEPCTDCPPCPDCPKAHAEHQQMHAKPERTPLTPDAEASATLEKKLGASPARPTDNDKEPAAKCKRGGQSEGQTTPGCEDAA